MALATSIDNSSAIDRVGFGAAEFRGTEIFLPGGRNLECPTGSLWRGNSGPASALHHPVGSFASGTCFRISLPPEMSAILEPGAQQEPSPRTEEANTSRPRFQFLFHEQHRCTVSPVLYEQAFQRTGAVSPGLPWRPRFSTRERPAQHPDQRRLLGHRA